MSRFFIDLAGTEPDKIGTDCHTIEEARDTAIVKLGRHLQSHPDFAHTGHWRVDVRNPTGRVLLHVVVATVVSPPAVNFASLEG